MTAIAETDLHDGEARHAHGPAWLAALTALGVVFGDIGTSPLYALQVAFKFAGDGPPGPREILGIISLTLWSLTLIVSVKYVALVMRADNEGEGGILALVALVSQGKAGRVRSGLSTLALLGICGAALLYGDGVITPAISVLSAIEGLKVAAPSLVHYVLPVTIGILVGLFLIQRRGTASIGRWFGPIMAIWFLAIALLGLRGLIAAPQILWAIDPRAALGFFEANPSSAFVVFGATFLALTGAEALYADMGHVGAPAIRLAWFGLAFPALVLNYLGQGGLLLVHPEAVDNPFYRLAPEWAVTPLLGLAAAATVIASQALISGVFSLSRQAILMRLSPRFTITPTSSRAYGQIYMPFVNWGLMGATIAVVILFKNSDSLAAAYGIAVSGTMLITTILLHRVMIDRWHWPALVAHLVALVFAAIDATYLSANALKLFDGGWLPLGMAAFVAFTMLAWRRGNDAVQDRLARNSLTFENFFAYMDKLVVMRLPGCGVFMTRVSDTVSPMLVQQLEHNRVFHENVILLTVLPMRRPRVPAAERLEIHDMGHGFWRVIVRIGFMQKPDVPLALRGCRKMGLEFCGDETHYYIAHESLVRSQKESALSPLVWVAFNIMHRMGLRASDYFHLPPRRVIEVGFRLEI